MVCNAAISWKSKKQTVTALSTCEAEYIATCSAAKEAIWLNQLWRSMTGSSSTDAILIHVDNDGSIDLAKKKQSAREQSTSTFDITLCGKL